jgi:maleate isomerase
MALTHTHGGAYGWRARIGVLSPSMVFDTHPFEFYLMAPPGVQLVMSSLEVGLMDSALADKSGGPRIDQGYGARAADRDAYRRTVDRIEALVQRLANRKVDAILQTGVPPLVVAGWGTEEVLRARVAKVTPAPYITDVTASIEAMKALGITRVAVASGVFDEELIGLIRDYLRHAGIELVGHQRIGLPGESGTLPMERVYRAARDVYRQSPQADGVWITHAATPSVSVIEALERDLGAPVMSSFQALVWAGLQMAGVRDRVTGFGRLFELSRP